MLGDGICVFLWLLVAGVCWLVISGWILAVRVWRLVVRVWMVVVGSWCMVICGWLFVVDVRWLVVGR